MVELQSSQYDTEYIPFVSAVSIDDEFLPLETTIATVQSVSSATADGSFAAPSQSQDYFSPEASPSQQQQNNRIRNGAAVGGAVLGLLLGGPFFSVVLGIGAAHYSKQEGATGDCARALGEVSLVAKDKFTTLNERHHLVDKGRDAAVNIQEQLHTVDREHKIQEKLYRIVRQCWTRTFDFVEQHHLIERGSEKFKVFLDKLSKNVAEHQNQVRDRPRQHDHKE
jgi:hypothetical protein